MSNDLNNLHSSFSHASLALYGQNVMNHGCRGNHGARFFPAMAVAARCVATAETGKSAPSTRLKGCQSHNKKTMHKSKHVKMKMKR